MDPEEIRASLINHAKKIQEEVIKPLYKDCLKNGWTLAQIDEMDIHFYFKLFQEEKKKVYIDEIW